MLNSAPGVLLLPTIAGLALLPRISIGVLPCPTSTPDLVKSLELACASAPIRTTLLGVARKNIGRRKIEIGIAHARVAGRAIEIVQPQRGIAAQDHSRVG